MKTIKNLVLAFFVFAAINVEAQKAPLSLLQTIDISQKFKIDIQQFDCFLNGKTIVARVNNNNQKNKNRYTFMWEIDGVPFGHDPLVECVSGRMATVHVTQYPSGIRLTKSVKLNSFPTR
ncbi:MAG: hypothetical protein AAFZ15_30350 [Bacteroidota bacterium]